MTPPFSVSLATRDDVAAILDLQDRNLRSNGGALSVPFSREWFEAAIADMPIIIARREDRLIGYLVSCPMEGQMHVPIIQAMLRAYPAPPAAYNYGPVCVAENARGQGVATAMFQDLCRRLQGRVGVTFIRADNTISVAAHANMGMRQVATFTLDGVGYVVVSYTG